MNTSSKSPMRYSFKLLLFYLILIQSTYRAIASTPKPRSGDISFENLPPSASIISKTNETGSTRNADATLNLPTKLDMDESIEPDEEDDLDSSAASPSIDISGTDLKNVDGVEEQVAAPSVTTMHQVWASSSSDSLEELSPEVISKLHNNVPFLAAYSIRPRLVGVSSNNQQSGAQQIVHPTGYSARLQAPSTAASEVAASRTDNDDGSSLQTGSASSPQNSLSRLGNFNEFKVELSSTSKSEHHHKRKTVLKRRDENQQPAELRSKKRQVANTVSRLKAERRRKSKRNSRKAARVGGRGRASRRQSLRDLQRSGRLIKRARSAAQKNQAKTSRLRRKLNGKNLQHHLSIIKHGRYLQEQSKPPNEATKGGLDEAGVKGGSGGKRTPFYSRAKPTSNGNATGEESLSGNGLGSGGSASGDNNIDENKSTSSDKEDAEDAELDEDAPAAPLPEPRRVGDPDVEDEGDTVAVAPKYDGVDDDPEPVEDGGSMSGEREAEADGDEKFEEKDDGEEPRTRRVNRERPNPVDDRSTASQDGQASGGGIGATIGGGPNEGTGLSRTDGKPDYDGDRMRDDDSGVRPSSREDDGGSSSGVDDRTLTNDRAPATGADRASGIDEESISDERDTDRDIERVSGKKNDGDSGGAGVDYDTKTKEVDEGSSGKEDGGSVMKTDEGLDVDYRDEMAADGDRRKKKPRVDDKKDENPSKKDKDCEEGSHHDHHSHHDDHHHDHHDTIKWLQDAIPGEPGEDYPILSRANATNFNCREQKYPGYYADVAARCQIFHICQADGRQDSFLCPNGTIFSQISSVCVWWNSFDCEDAPKYYKLNELLYKSRPRSSVNEDADGYVNPSRTRSDDQTDDLRPLEVGASQAGSRRRASGNEDDESSIDSLIREMQQEKAIGRRQGDKTGVTYEQDSARRDPGGKAVMMDNGIGAYDEATIQRKSTNPIDEDLSGLDEASARLKNQRRPRRKRRASAKQSPRKLKPGRYPRRRPVGKTINKIRGPAIKQKRRA